MMFLPLMSIGSYFESKEVAPDEKSFPSRAEPIFEGTGCQRQTESQKPVFIVS